MDGHKDEHGVFHPHTQHQSSIHASDVNQNRTKLKQELVELRKKHPKEYGFKEDYSISKLEEKVRGRKNVLSSVINEAKEDG